MARRVPLVNCVLSRKLCPAQPVSAGCPVSWDPRGTRVKLVLLAQWARRATKESLVPLAQRVRRGTRVLLAPVASLVHPVPAAPLVPSM